MKFVASKTMNRVMALGALAVGVIGVGMVRERWEFGINTTGSLSNWAYVVDRYDVTPQRGELVRFSPPKNRHYPETAKFVKRVAGVPGDLVEARGRDFYVAGRFVGRAKDTAKDGAVAPMGSVGVLGPDQYFVLGEHKDSLDSRYAHIGWVSADRIRGVATPVL